MMGRPVLHSGSPVRMRLLFLTSQSLKCSERWHSRRDTRRRCATRCSNADEVLRSVSGNGEVSIMVVKGTNLVQEVSPLAGTVLQASQQGGYIKVSADAWALLGTLLMGCFKAEGEATQVTFKGDGPLGGIQVIADALGNVKGKVGNPEADPPLRPDGKLNVGEAVGRGVLAVVRSNVAQDRPYTGLTEIRSGEVAEDLASYLVDSEQANSALALGVSISRDASVRAAGGYLVQVLPFASEATLAQLEANIAGCPSVTDMLHEGNDARAITARILAGLGVMDQGFSLKPRYGPCEAESLKGRMKRAVALLGAQEVDDIIAKEGKIEVSCEFCRQTYQFGKTEVLAALETANG